jgi:hypothetical protein
VRSVGLATDARFSEGFSSVRGGGL